MFGPTVGGPGILLANFLFFCAREPVNFVYFFNVGREKKVTNLEK